MSVDVSKAVCQQLMESSTATLTSVLRLHGLKKYVYARRRSPWPGHENGRTRLCTPRLSTRVKTSMKFQWTI